MPIEVLISDLLPFLNDQAMFKIGKTIKRLRTEADMSQKELAHEADLTPSFLSLIESGEREPSLATIRRLAEGLDTAEEVIIWDAVQIPDGLDAEDKRICELAKMLVRKMFEAADVNAG